MLHTAVDANVFSELAINLTFINRALQNITSRQRDLANENRTIYQRSNYDYRDYLSYPKISFPLTRPSFPLHLVWSLLSLSSSLCVFPSLLRHHLASLVSVDP